MNVTLLSSYSSLLQSQPLKKIHNLYKVMYPHQAPGQLQQPAIKTENLTVLRTFL